jgi:hypothetical protein
VYTRHKTTKGQRKLIVFIISYKQWKANKKSQVKKVRFSVCAGMFSTFGTVKNSGQKK